MGHRRRVVERCARGEIAGLPRVLKGSFERPASEAVPNRRSLFGTRYQDTSKSAPASLASQLSYYGGAWSSSGF